MTGARRELVVGLTWAAAITMIWTAFHLSGRLGAQLTLTPFDLTTLRMAAAGLIGLPWLVRHGLGGLRLWQALVLAIAAGPGFSVFAFGGYLFAPAAHGATILAGTLPLFTAPLAWWLTGERIGAGRAVSITMIFTGAMLLLADATTSGQPDQWIGDVSFFVGAASWSLFGVLARKWQVDPLRGAAIVASLSLAIYTPVHLLFLPSGLTEAPWQEIAAQWVFQGIVVFIASTFGYTRAVGALGANATATIVAFVPAAVALVAWFALNEALSAIAVAGIALVVVGMFAGSVRVRRQVAIAP